MGKPLWILCTLITTTILFGCGGGGGGGGSGGLTTTLFIDWSSVEPPENVGLTGISQDTDYDVDPDNPPFTITDHGVSTGSTATIRYRADGSIERIDVVTPYIALSWNEAKGDSVFYAPGDPWVIAASATELELGVLFNPLEMDPADAWEYQTFGAWATGRGIDTGAIGAMSVGTPTPGDAIPAPQSDLGAVTFTGHSAGIYTTSDGEEAYLTTSAVSVDVNFFDRELILNTTGTTLTNVETGDPWTNGPPPTLDVTGTLTYATGVNSFTGSVTANGATGGMTGQSTGQFYGPLAEELGGVFSLSGAEKEYYSGAYGAAQ